MICSDKIDQIIPALLEAQKAFGKVVADTENKHLKTKYAKLISYLDAVVPRLHDKGIIIAQPTRVFDGVTILETRLIHAASCQWIGSEYIIRPTKSDHQAEGSALTYARRYSLASLLGLSSEDDDDDGNGAIAGKPNNSSDEKMKEAEKYKQEIPTATAERLVEIGKKLAGLGIPQDKLSELRDAWAKRNKELSGK